MNEWGQEPWPGRKPSAPKPRKGKKGSGTAPRGTVGMAILAFLALPAGLVLGMAAFLLRGYGVI